jgi:hypothetical protein
MVFSCAAKNIKVTILNFYYPFYFILLLLGSVIFQHNIAKGQSDHLLQYIASLVSTYHFYQNIARRQSEHLLEYPLSLTLPCHILSHPFT